MINRRRLLATAPALLIAGCANQTPQQRAVELATAKVWVAAIANAVGTASFAYVGPNASQVRQAAAGLQVAANAFQSIVEISTARSAALSFVTAAQQIMPVITPLLGQQNALYVPLGLIVVQAFVASLPLPPDAPPAPPAAMSKGPHSPEAMYRA